MMNQKRFSNLSILSHYKNDDGLDIVGVRNESVSNFENERHRAQQTL